jgi:glycosyltransferase involved in cell wall biosynthesis
VISVITPVLNGRQYLEGCVACVAAQAAEGLEHVVVDGGSHDGGAELLARLAEAHSHVRWVSEPDAGQSDALNKGIGMARGDVIGILNVDDRYEPGVLARVTELFATIPRPAFVAANCHVWHPDGSLAYVNCPDHLELRDLLLGSPERPYPVNPSAYFYDRTLHDLVGWYDVAQHYAMDVDFVFRAVQVAHLLYVPEWWGNFHAREDCKTVVDSRAGTAQRRRNALYRAYRRSLPPVDRLRAAVSYETLHTPIGRTLRLGVTRSLQVARAIRRRLTGSPRRAPSSEASTTGGTPDKG